MVELYGADPEVVIWWGTAVEVASAVGRLERSGELRSEAASAALERWSLLEGVVHEVAPSEAVRSTAVRLLRVHDLRSGDALQLGAAVIAAESRPATLDLVSLDRRLGTAALKEGFSVLGLS